MSARAQYEVIDGDGNVISTHTALAEARRAAVAANGKVRVAMK